MLNGFVKVIVILFIFIIQYATMAFAVEEKVLNINFDCILKQAKTHSYDIKIADFDTFISKQGLRTARSEYFPKINISAGTEYTKNFDNNSERYVSVVGDAFINPYTRYQTLMGITLAYNIFDFGQKKNRLDITKEDVELKELLAKEQEQELELALIDLYAKLFMIKKQIDINQEILELANKNFEYKTRLFDAGEISKEELNNQALEVRKYEQRLLNLYSLAQESLNWLSFYTKQEYQLEFLNVAAFKKADINPMDFNDYTKSLTWQIYEKNIKKKELELSVAKKNYLPKINLYSRYYLHGSDPISYNKTLDDVGPSNYTIGATIFMPVFDGFKTSAEIQTANLELQKELAKRDQAIAQFNTRLATMRSNLVYLDKQIPIDEKIISELTDKERINKRLLEKKEIMPIEYNEAKIALFEQEIELLKNKTTVYAITRAIQALTVF